MTIPRLFCIPPSASLLDAYEKMNLHGVHHLVVTQDDEVLGIISDRNLFEKGMSAGRLSLTQTVRDVMVADLPVLTEDHTLADVLEAMASAQVTGLPVTQQGKASGIVTNTDVCRYLREKLSAEPSEFDKLEFDLKKFAGHPLSVRMMELLNDVGI